MAKLQIRNITKKSLIYSIGTIISSLSTLLLIPIFSKYLLPSEYGKYELSYSLTFLIITISFFETHITMLRFMYGIKNEDNLTKKQAIYSSAFFRTFSTILLIGIGFIVSKITYYPFEKVSLFFGFCFTSGLFYLNCARGFDKEYEYTTAFSIFHITNLISNVIFLIFLKKGADTLFISLSLSYIAQILYLEIKLKIISSFKRKYINFKLIRKMLKFSIPLAIAAVGIWILQFYSNIRIVALLGSRNNGLYTMALNFARSIPAFANGAIIAWEEIAFSVRGTNDEKNYYFSKIIGKVIVNLSCIYIVFIPFVRLIIPFYLDTSYHDIIVVVVIATAGRTIDFFSLFLASIFGNQINSKPLMISTSIGAVVDLLIINYMINKYGIIGAAISDCIGFIIVVLIRFFWLKFENNYNIQFMKITLFILISLIVGYLSVTLSYNHIFILLAISICISSPILLSRPIMKIKEFIKMKLNK